MNILLWIIQALLSSTFIWSAFMKLFQPDKVAQMWPWAAEHPQLSMITGVFDFLAGVGLVLPMLLRIQPRLTVYAAYGAILLMIAAMAFHISRGEGSQIGFNVFVLVLAGFVAWGRRKS